MLSACALVSGILLAAGCGPTSQHSSETTAADTAAAVPDAVQERRLVDGRRIAAADTEPHNRLSNDRTHDEQRFSGADYPVITDNFNLFGQQEFIRGSDQQTQAIHVGPLAHSWSGAALQSGVSQSAGEFGPRMFADYGLPQNIALTEQWQTNIGIDRMAAADGALVGPLNLQARPAAADFAGAWADTNYLHDGWQGSSHLEMRRGNHESRTNLSLGLTHDLAEGVVLTSLFDMRTSDSLGNRQSNANLQLGYALRPSASRWNLLSRLDVQSNESSGDASIIERKLINNFNANYKPDQHSELTFQFGLKFTDTTIDGTTDDGLTDLFGFEYHRTIGNRWDIGAGFSTLGSHESGARETSYNLSVGRNMGRNMWFGFGYNFDGFTDRDFDNTGYTANGMHMKFRMKFD